MKKILFLLFISSYSFSQSPFLIEEEFDSAPTAPSGWTFSISGSYSSGQNSGKTTNSLQFKNGDKITSPTWANGDQLTYMMRATSTPNSTDKMKVELLISGVWTTIGNDGPHTTARMLVYDISTSATQARFTYTKGNTNVAFDDFTIRQSGKCTGIGPYITSINADACGSGCEGRDEFFTFSTGSTAMNLSDIEISYPDANNSTVTWCGSTSNAPCDNYITNNSAEITALNTLAGCPVFIDPSGSIPAFAPVMVFNGNAQNTRANFGSLCSGGTPLVNYFGLFANNTSDCNGRFGNHSSTAGCTPECYRGFFIRDRGTGCADTNYYFEDALGTTDGSITTYASAGASPVYQQTTCNSFLILPVSILSFYAIYEQDEIKIIWQTATENDLADFIIERSTDGQNYKSLGKIKPTNTNTTHLYSFSDADVNDPVTGYYYRLVSVDKNGSEHYYKSIFVPLFIKNGDVKIISNNNIIKVLTNDNSATEKTIEIFDANGTKLLSDAFISSYYEFPASFIENKFSLIRIIYPDRIIVKKLVATTP